MLVKKYNIFKQNVTATLIMGLSLFILPTTQAKETIDKQLDYQTKRFDYQLPKNQLRVCQIKNNCPRIDIYYVYSQQDWVDKIVNKAVNEYIMEKEVTKTLTKEEIERKIDYIVKWRFNGIRGILAYNLSAKPKFIGKKNNNLLFSIDFYQYTGGIRGKPSKKLLVVNPKLKRKLDLDDVLVKGKKSSLETLMYQEFRQWIKKEVKTPIKNYEKDWAFYLSDNFSFNNKGMVFLYQPREISDEEFGIVEFNIPYQKLKGIIKSEYLPI